MAKIEIVEELESGAKAVFSDPDSIQKKLERELLGRAAVIRERARRNVGEIRQKDPAKAYIWVHNVQENIAKRHGLGYEFVITKKEGSENEPQTSYRRSDGKHVWGDLILMQADKNFHDALKALPALESVEAIRGPRDGLKAWADANGMPLKISQEE